MVLHRFCCSGDGGVCAGGTAAARGDPLVRMESECALSCPILAHVDCSRNAMWPSTTPWNFGSARHLRLSPSLFPFTRTLNPCFFQGRRPQQCPAIGTSETLCSPVRPYAIRGETPLCLCVSGEGTGWGLGGSCLGGANRWERVAVEGKTETDQMEDGLETGGSVTRASGCMNGRDGRGARHPHSSPTHQLTEPGFWSLQNGGNGENGGKWRKMGGNGRNGGEMGK